MLGQVPWVARWAESFPRAGRNLKRFRAFTKERLRLRMDEGSKRKDLLYHLVRIRNSRSHYSVILGLFLKCILSGRRSGCRETADPCSNSTLGLHSRHRCRLVNNRAACTTWYHSCLWLGSDTTATVLSSLFFYLLQDPKKFERLRAEIDKYYPQGEEITANHFSEMDYLEACINEALRLSPPVPSGSQRAALHPDPSSGKMLGP